MILKSNKLVVGSSKAFIHGKALSTSDELDSLKTSVSEGKSLIAAAVTGKGVTTAADATFATISSNIGSITQGYDIVINSVTISANSRSITCSSATGKQNIVMFMSSTIENLFADFIMTFTCINGVNTTIVMPRNGGLYVNPGGYYNCSYNPSTGMVSASTIIFSASLTYKYIAW